jgi:hypothetical protein
MLWLLIKGANPKPLSSLASTLIFGKGPLVVDPHFDTRRLRVTNTHPEDLVARLRNEILPALKLSDSLPLAG